MIERKCKECGIALAEEAHFNTKYCPPCAREVTRRISRDHQRKANGYKRHANCNWCGGSMPRDSSPFERLCSDKCRSLSSEAAFRKGRLKQRKRFITECRVCGNVIPPGAHGNSAHCSPECKKVSKSNHFKKYYRRNPSKYQDHNAVRRAKIKEATTDNVDRIRVFERDGWECHICGDPISKEAVWPSPESVSLDHVIPLSKGGAHSYDNCKAAHWGCNSAKGDRPLEACQL